jgi:hypothetical protein
MTKAADMLGQMARKAHDLACQIEHLRQVLVAGIEARAACASGSTSRDQPAPFGAGDRGDGIVGQAEHLAHLAAAERAR